MGTEFHFCETQGILDTDGSDGCTIMGMYIMSLNCTLKKKKRKGRKETLESQDETWTIQSWKGPAGCPDQGAQPRGAA